MDADRASSSSKSRQESAKDVDGGPRPRDRGAFYHSSTTSRKGFMNAHRQRTWSTRSLGFFSATLWTPDGRFPPAESETCDQRSLFLQSPFGHTADRRLRRPLNACFQDGYGR